MVPLRSRGSVRYPSHSRPHSRAPPPLDRQAAATLRVIIPLRQANSEALADADSDFRQQLRWAGVARTRQLISGTGEWTDVRDRRPARSPTPSVRASPGERAVASNLDSQFAVKSDNHGSRWAGIGEL